MGNGSRLIDLRTAQNSVHGFIVEALDEAERDRLRELDRQIAEDPDAAELQAVMRRYYRWMKNLPLYRRAARIVHTETTIENLKGNLS